MPLRGGNTNVSHLSHSLCERIVLTPYWQFLFCLSCLLGSRRLTLTLIASRQLLCLFTQSDLLISWAAVTKLALGRPLYALPQAEINYQSLNTITNRSAWAMSSTHAMQETAAVKMINLSMAFLLISITARMLQVIASRVLKMQPCTLNKWYNMALQSCLF